MHTAVILTFLRVWVDSAVRAIHTSLQMIHQFMGIINYFGTHVMLLRIYELCVKWFGNLKCNKLIHFIIILFHFENNVHLAFCSSFSMDENIKEHIIIKFYCASFSTLSLANFYSGFIRFVYSSIFRFVHTEFSWNNNNKKAPPSELGSKLDVLHQNRHSFVCFFFISFPRTKAC